MQFLEQQLYLSNIIVEERYRHDKAKTKVDVTDEESVKGVLRLESLISPKQNDFEEAVFDAPINRPMDIDNQKIGIALPISSLFSTLRALLDDCGPILKNFRGTSLGNAENWLVNNDSLFLQQIDIHDIDLEMIEEYTNVFSNIRYTMVKCRGHEDKIPVDKSDPNWRDDCKEEKTDEEEETTEERIVFRIGVKLTKFKATVQRL